MHAENRTPVPVCPLMPATMARRFGISLLRGSGFRKSYNPLEARGPSSRGGWRPIKTSCFEMYFSGKNVHDERYFPAFGRSFPSRIRKLCGKGSQRGGQTALVARGLVFMNNLLVRNAVDGTGRGAKNFNCTRLVAGANRLARGLDRGSQARAQAGVVRVELDGLSGAFAGLSSIGHEVDFQSGLAETAGKVS
jgi:hypothetical protein